MESANPHSFDPESAHSFDPESANPDPNEPPVRGAGFWKHDERSGENPLPGGFQQGDRVRSLIAYQNVKVGDQGTVIGRSQKQELRIGEGWTPSSADEYKRVCVDMGPGKGRVNFVASSQLEHAPQALTLRDKAGERSATTQGTTRGKLRGGPQAACMPNPYLLNSDMIY